MSLRRLLLKLARSLGGFAAARALTSGGLRILCYHGISLADEELFDPKLFMREETFRGRLAWLRRQGYPVLALDRALDFLDRGCLPARAVVITFDDGWLGTGTLAAPALYALGYPSTVYVTTRDAVDAVPVFRVTVGYLLWRGRTGSLDAAALGIGDEPLPLREPGQRASANERIWQTARDYDAEGRTALLRKLASQLGVDWDALDRARLFRLMTLEELAALPALGMDLQLHTHTHAYLPRQDRAAVETEIGANRESLSAIAVKPLAHFCYPGGAYQPHQLPWLRAMGIASAATCTAGFNYPATDRLELRRFLDGEHISQVEFEAEASGFLELMRRMRGRLRALLGGAGGPR